MRKWQLLLEGRCRPADTMSGDLDLLEAVRSGRIEGTLRIYNWSEPALSIGYHQRSFTFHDPSLVIPVIHRPTGGGAVLHYDDITFGIAAQCSGVFSGTIPEISRRVSSTFQSALKSCGLTVQMSEHPHAFSDLCFHRTSPGELILGDTKILGLALAKRSKHLLIQGVIPIRVNPELSAQVFGNALPEALKGICDHLPDFSEMELVKSLCEFFSSEMGILLEKSIE